MSLYDKTRSELDAIAAIAEASDEDDDGTPPRWAKKDPRAKNSFMARYNVRASRARCTAP